MALPFIVGANIGSCGIAFIGAMGGDSRGMRIAWAELIVRFVAGFIMLSFPDFFVNIAIILADSPAREIAHLHTMYALIAVVIFMPFTKLLARFVEKIIHSGKSGTEFGPIYLDTNALSNPPIALGSAAREILRQGDIVLSMVDDIFIALKKFDGELLQKIIDRDDKVDTEQESITDYLTCLSESELSAVESRTEMELITIALELEHIADVVSKNISRHVVKRLDEGYYFSKEGLGEIEDFHARIRNLLRKALDIIPLRDKNMARWIIDETKDIVSQQRRLNQSHIERLHAGVKYSAETSAIHIDLLSDLTRIAVHISSIAYAILGKV
jgi:phosphate:Na+ symporter